MTTNPSDVTDPKNLSREDIAQLPKVVLHDHLDGGLRAATIVELAEAAGYGKLPTTDPEELEHWFVEAANSGSLPKYLETFDHTTAVMQTAEAIMRVTAEAVVDLAADNVVYAELRFAPEQHQSQGLSLQDIVDAAVAGCQQGEAQAAQQGKQITARLILCAMRPSTTTHRMAMLLGLTLPARRTGSRRRATTKHLTCCAATMCRLLFTPARLLAVTLWNLQSMRARSGSATGLGCMRIFLPTWMESKRVG